MLMQPLDLGSQDLVGRLLTNEPQQFTDGRADHLSLLSLIDPPLDRARGDLQLQLFRDVFDQARGNLAGAGLDRGALPGQLRCSGVSPKGLVSRSEELSLVPWSLWSFGPYGREKRQKRNCGGCVACGSSSILR